MSKNRTLASLISNDTSKVKQTYIDSDAIVTSASLGVTAAAGTATYSSADTLPASADNGDQALVTSTNRLYIYTNGGWYNIALINSTPYWSSEASSTYELSTTGASTVITILAVDSEGIPITYTATTDSDFDAIATVTKDSDNGRVFTVIPTDSDGGTAVAGTGTITFKASDGVNLVSTLSTFSIIFTVSNSNYTTLLLKADTSETDDQVDASTNANTITQVGTVDSTALSPYHPGGYSTYFDGSGDYLTLPDNSTLELSNNDFTIELWIKSNSSTQYATPVSRTDASFASGMWSLMVNVASATAGDVAWYMADYSSGTPLVQTTGVDVTDDAWHHIALVRNGSTFTIYVDGVSRGTGTSSATIADRAAGISIGRDQFYNRYYIGYIRDFRIVNGTAVYTSAFTPPIKSLTAITNTSLFTCHLPYIADGSSNDHTVTIVGNTLTRRFGPYNYSSYSKSTDGGSVYVGGATSYVSTNLPAMTGDWTIEGWFQHTANTGLSFQNRLFGAATNDPMILNTGTTSLAVYIDNNLKISANAAANTAAGINRWYHMALVRETTGNTLKLYINGKLAGSQSSGTYDIDAKDPFGIGSDANNSAYGMTGYIADFRVVNGTAVYTAEFTPPTEPLTEITNTDLLTCTNKNDIWDTGSSVRVSKVGNATSSNTQRKFATSSAMAFDGTGDYITAPGSLLSMGSEDYTAEGWFYFNSLPSSGASWHTLFAFRDGSNEGVALYVDGATPHLEPYTGSQQATGSTTLSTGQWYHIAFVRNSGTVYGYVNGNQDFTYSYSTTVGDVTTGYVGGNGAQDMNGYIQDLRITKGLARYTSAFTPPTAEFSG